MYTIFIKAFLAFLLEIKKFYVHFKCKRFVAFIVLAIRITDFSCLKFANKHNYFKDIVNTFYDIFSY